MYEGQVVGKCDTHARAHTHTPLREHTHTDALIHIYAHSDKRMHILPSTLQKLPSQQR